MPLHIKFVRAPYLIDEKGITEADWASIGIEHPDVWFNRSNRYMVDASSFPDEVVDYFRSDPDFSITEAENPKPPGPAALVARGPSGTDPELQGFADEGDGKNNLEGQADFGVGGDAEKLSRARKATTVGGSTAGTSSGRKATTTGGSTPGD